NVLDGFLSQIVIDPIDLILVEDAEQLPIELTRRLEIGAERLLDDDAPPCAVLLARKADFAELADDQRESGRRRRQIEQAIATGRARSLDALERLTQPLVGLRIVELALHVVDGGQHRSGGPLIHGARGELAQAFLQAAAEGFARELL